MKKFIAASILAFSVAGLAYASNLSVDSEVQHYNEKNKKIEIKGNVKVKYDDVNVVSPNAEVLLNSKTGKPETVKFMENAYSYQVKADKKHEVKAKILEVSLLNKVFKAKERTQSTVLEKGQPTVIVTANSQEYDNKTNTMKAKGAVIINYKDVQAFADYAEVNLNKQNDVQKLTLSGHAYLKQGNSQVRASKFVHLADKKITTATGNVFSDINTNDTKIKVWSDFQQVNQNANTISASGHAKIVYEDYVAVGPKATVYPNKENKLNRVVFMGRSKITNKGYSIEADKIEMTLKPKDFKAEGNVKTLLQDVGSGNSSSL